MTFNNVDQVTSAIKQCITDEMVPDGILEDVETFIPSYRLEEPMDLPAVWLYEHPTVLSDDRRTLDGLLSVTTPFEFVCVEYDDDIETAEIKGKNLAWRVGHVILNNRSKLVNRKKVFSKIEFKTLYPVGEVQIQGKLNKIPATSIVFDVSYMVNVGETPSKPVIQQAVMGTIDTEVVAEELYKKEKNNKKIEGV